MADFGVCILCGKRLPMKNCVVTDIDGDGKTAVYCQKCYTSHSVEATRAQNVLKIQQEEARKLEQKRLAELAMKLPVATDYDDLLDFYLDYAIEIGASDLHLKSKSLPVVRIQGQIRFFHDILVQGEDVERFIMEKASVFKQDLDETAQAIDFSVEHNGVRMRCNAYKDMNGWCISLRLLTLVGTDFDELGIPHIIKDLAKRKSGLILITGPTGSGKTTTLTCLLNHMNKTQSSHIIMLEDPIEFVHPNNKCLISQREVGRDTTNFSEAITEAVREDPDIILVGEMRDRDSVEAAIRAAETGHLVLSTLHTKGAGNSVDRIIDIFPPELQNQMRTQISTCLLGVISQQLIPSVDGGRRYLATEVMVNTPSISNLIRLAKTHMITSTIQLSKSDGMYTMQESLEKLYKEGKITLENRDLYQI